MTAHSPREELPTAANVIVVGAGPVGLTAGLLLARAGLSVLIVERRRGTSVLPRATGVNVRSMEIFRTLGLEPAVSAASLSADGVPFLLVGESLVTPVRATIESQQYQSATPANWPSPTRAFWCAQDQLEPLLLAAVTAEATAQVRFHTELLSLSDRGECVAADVRRDQWETQTVKCDYLIAADGAHSTVRRQLGIHVTGQEAIADELTILFHADLESLLAGRRFLLHRVDNPAVTGVLRPAGATDRWLLGTPDAADTSIDRCVELVRAAVGVADLEVEILATGTWQAAAVVADEFRRGRVFLCGDAAHQHTPGGGFGMNSGIQAAHNLAWKLVGVLQGWAGPRLLDTYQTERQPLAEWTTRLSVERLQSGVTRSANTLGAVLGPTYASTAVLADGTAPVETPDPVADYRQSARPGQRAPHVWLDTARTVSTLDQFGDRFVLLTPTGETWRAPVATATDTGAPLHLEDHPSAKWARVYGVYDGGAVLVRPDGFVGARWPRPPRQPEVTLREALFAVTH